MVQVNASDTLEDDFLADVLQVAGASLTIARLIRCIVEEWAEIPLRGL